MIKAFPKIFAIGTTYIQDIFKNDVEISEKIDGSQFCFGKISGELFMRSKGAQIFPENPEKMFVIASDYVLSVENKISDNTIYFCEYLKKPKHNTLAYSRVPKNNLILFSVCDNTERFIASYDELLKKADEIEIETVPLVFSGKINDPQAIFDLINAESVLGGVDMEGIVVKNYFQPFLLGGQPIPLMAGKLVSEKFKEVHQKNWGKENTGKGKYELFKDSFRTEARWEKAVQHLRDSGNLDCSPKDIGSLIKEVHSDIISEEKESIKAFLFKEFGQEIIRKSTAGLAEWYKEKLIKDSFEESDNKACN